MDGEYQRIPPPAERIEACYSFPYPARTIDERIRNWGDNMTESTDKEAGIIQALAEQLEKHRLPMALELKAKVDEGGRLNEADIAFLEEVFANSTRLKPLLDAHPEWQDLAAQMIGLYGEITAKALENEQAAQQDE
jgi:hypothetical protein